MAKGRKNISKKCNDANRRNLRKLNPNNTSIKENAMLKLLTLLIYPIVLYIILKNHIFSHYYLAFICTIISIYLSVLLICFAKKREVNYFAILYFTLIMIASFSTGGIAKRNVKKNDIYKFDGECISIEWHDFPQSELLIKKYKLLFFSDDVGKIILPKNSKYKVIIYNAKIAIMINNENEMVNYTIDIKSGLIEENPPTTTRNVNLEYSENVDVNTQVVVGTVDFSEHTDWYDALKNQTKDKDNYKYTLFDEDTHKLWVIWYA